MQLTLDTLKKMVGAIAHTQEEEIGCAECFEELDKFVEMELAGKNASEAMPLVRAHLDRCMNCKEEYEALYDAIKNA